MNTCLIPCFNRPEFLYLCLERISKAKGSEDILYIFQIDYGHARDIEKVIDHFHYPKKIFYTPNAGLRSTKQSYSLLTGYQNAYEHSDGLVFMVEEDIMIGEDFFQWHDEVHRQNPDIFCSIATKNNNRRIEASGSVTDYYVSSGDYQSLGVCFNEQILQEYVFPHFNKTYLTFPGEYVKKNFPDSAIGSAFSEQDGLIRRIEELHGIGIAFPYIPRAYHAGFYGKNRGKYFYAPLEQKISYVKGIIFDQARMESKAQRPEYFQDSVPIKLELSHWKKLTYKPL